MSFDLRRVRRTMLTGLFGASALSGNLDDGLSPQRRHARLANSSSSSFSASWPCQLNNNNDLNRCQRRRLNSSVPDFIAPEDSVSFGGGAAARNVTSSSEDSVQTPPAMPVPDLDRRPVYCDFGDPDQICTDCGALFWYQERARSVSRVGHPRYNTCGNQNARN